MVSTPVSPRIHAALDALRDALAEVADAALVDGDTPAGFLRGIALIGFVRVEKSRLNDLALAHGLTVAAPLPAAAE